MIETGVPQYCGKVNMLFRTILGSMMHKIFYHKLPNICFGNIDLFGEMQGDITILPHMNVCRTKNLVILKIINFHKNT